ncbi:hypothetical protein [Embleya sp. NPDC050493]|uniref:hypothetical protein n=1 Tax=Embleya sp. NPDC050493 TaxID=3363989 RepID=UPI0037B31B3D
MSMITDVHVSRRGLPAPGRRRWTVPVGAAGLDEGGEHSVDSPSVMAVSIVPSQ